MSHQVTIGGDRLGSGNKNKVTLKGFERSTHDRGYVWRSTMAAGTLVPFMTEVALPGDTFDIDLNCDVLTHPTIGPLFGSYKIQLDVFQIPVRLYNGKLHMNMLKIGMDMSKVKLPQVYLIGNKIDAGKQIDNQQMNPSAIFSYLGIRGMGYNELNTTVGREFNAIPWLGYWDIYKNYYANKQEDVGAVIHKDVTPANVVITSAGMNDTNPEINIPINPAAPYVFQLCELNNSSRIIIGCTGLTAAIDPANIWVRVANLYNGELPPSPPVEGSEVRLTTIFKSIEILVPQQIIVGEIPSAAYNNTNFPYAGIRIDNTQNNSDTTTEPTVKFFPLADIDTMRTDLLKWSDDTDFVINGTTLLEPYKSALQGLEITANNWNLSYLYSQEGLALKTYNSDLFNNWISTEWIDGVDGISAITAIDTSEGSFTIDELNLSKKIYDMLNRIAISGGSYDDWLDAVYENDRRRSIESPMYLGGLIQNLVFQEVVSNAASQDQPLGTLAGRGTIGKKRKGGQITAKIDEPSIIMGIISLTPNIDYSQGNKWDTNLKTMNDFHKPSLDEIGFQDLITDQMAWYDTKVPTTTEDPVFKSAGKQPAWINYMTNVNVVKGNFADQTQQMFMVLNRRYGVKYPGAGAAEISDLTTYIDPTKFNHIFADTRRDAQNFWAQIGVNMQVRQKMSAKIMPNL